MNAWAASPHRLRRRVAIGLLAAVATLLAAVPAKAAPVHRRTQQLAAAHFTHLGLPRPHRPPPAFVKRPPAAHLTSWKRVGSSDDATPGAARATAALATTTATGWIGVAVVSVAPAPATARAPPVRG